MERIEKKNSLLWVLGIEIRNGRLDSWDDRDVVAILVNLEVCEKPKKLILICYGEIEPKQEARKQNKVTRNCRRI